MSEKVKKFQKLIAQVKTEVEFLDLMVKYTRFVRRNENNTEFFRNYFYDLEELVAAKEIEIFGA